MPRDSEAGGRSPIPNVRIFYDLLVLSPPLSHSTLPSLFLSLSKSKVRLGFLHETRGNVELRLPPTHVRPFRCCLSEFHVRRRNRYLQIYYSPHTPTRGVGFHLTSRTRSSRPRLFMNVWRSPPRSYRTSRK